MKTLTTSTLPRNAIMRAALAKLNECRAKCSGIGGDVDAMNLRDMIERGEWQRSTTDQAAKCLDWMGRALQIDTTDEAAALRLLPLFETAPDMREALRDMKAALTTYNLRDVKKRFSLCVADAAASTAIHKAQNRFDNPLVTDGTDSNGDLAGDGELAPFYVFDPIKQDNVAGPFETRAEADAVRDKMA